MGWRLALSLQTLREEFNVAYPGRSKRSDGTIGDPDHASRASRHNKNRHDVVTALDITHDPASGCDVHAEARRIAADPHPELAYIISNRQIASRTTGFGWRPYSGSNPHTAHAHFAVGVGPDSDPRPPYDSRQPWGVHTAQEPEPEEEPVNVPPLVKKAGDNRVWVGVGQFRSHLADPVWKAMDPRAASKIVTLADDDPFWDLPVLEQSAGAGHVHKTVQVAGPAT